MLAEMRFGSGWVMWPDLMPKFWESERLTRTKFPGFCAGAIISGLSPERPDGHEVLNACLEARKAGLSGIDFIPMPYEREAGRDHWNTIYSWAERVGDAGLGVTVHAGEFSQANIRTALSVPGVTRIGHAVHAAYSTSLLNELIEAQVTVECCLTSNIILGSVSSLEDHPIRTFIEVGVPVTLSSDDPLGLGTTIETEYELAARLGFNALDLLGFTSNGIAASFTSSDRKRDLTSRIEQK